MNEWTLMGRKQTSCPWSRGTGSCRVKYKQEHISLRGIMQSVLKSMLTRQHVCPFVCVLFQPPCQACDHADPSQSFKGCHQSVPDVWVFMLHLEETCCSLMKHVFIPQIHFFQSLFVLLSAQGLSVTCVDPVSIRLYICSFKQVATRWTSFFNSTQVDKWPHPHRLFQIRHKGACFLSHSIFLSRSTNCYPFPLFQPDL